MRRQALLLLVLAGCARTTPAPPARAESQDAPDAAPASQASRDAAPVSAAADAARAPCDGVMPCAEFASPVDAWNAVLKSAPLVLAVGETHAQKDTEGVASATKRFTEQLLPTLQGRASDLVLELWVANGACGKQEKRVATQQKDVTRNQAETDQNEFVVLGNAANARGIKPHVLLPPCDEYARILDAGAGDVDAMLSIIARLTARRIAELLPKAKASGKTIVAYGGAMHNDATPREGREAWSFGPAAIKASDGKYVELDLIVPEMVKDTEAWRAQPWYAHYDASAHRAQTLLYTTGPRSYALIFPRVTP